MFLPNKRRECCHDQSITTGVFHVPAQGRGDKERGPEAAQEPQLERQGGLRAIPRLEVKPLALVEEAGGLGFRRSLVPAPKSGPEILHRGGEEGRPRHQEGPPGRILHRDLRQAAAEGVRQIADDGLAGDRRIRGVQADRGPQEEARRRLPHPRR